MIIRKNIRTSIDLYANEPYELTEAMIIRKLETKYLNKNFNSMLVQKIVHIIDHTYPLVEDDKQNCCASIDVYFCAEGLIVMVGEILHGCVCIEKSNVNMFARKGDNIVISISRSEEQLASYITKGSKVSLIATEAQYTVNKSQITVMAKPFVITPNEREVIFQITDTSQPDEDNMNLLNLIYKNIAEEEERHKKIADPKAYDFFKKIMYPYQKEQNILINDFYKKLDFKPVAINLDDIKKMTPKYILYPSQDSRINKRYLCSESKINVDKLKDFLIVKCNVYTALYSIFTQYLIYMQGLRGFTENYTGEDIKNSIAYWKLCSTYKK